jgi:cbb3-type cytochrome oxidase maturation protein
MSVLVLLIAAGATVAGGFLCAFVWAVRSGQFDDTASPPLRMLLDDAPRPSRPSRPGARTKESHPHVH